MTVRSKGFFVSVFLALLGTGGFAVWGTPAQPQQDARQRGAAIAAAAAEAAGGAALTKVESVELTIRRQFYLSQKTFETEVQLWIVYPTRMRIDESIAAAALDQKATFASAEGYDGDSGWLKTQKSTTDLPFDDWAQLRMDLFGGLGVFRQAALGKLEAEFAGEDEVQGHKALAVEWIRSHGGMKLYFDSQSHLLMGTGRREHSNEGTFDILQTWSDYKPVAFKSGENREEIRFPFTSDTYRNGKKYIEEKVKKIRLNSQPDLKIFAKPN